MPGPNPLYLRNCRKRRERDNKIEQAKRKEAEECEERKYKKDLDHMRNVVIRHFGGHVPPVYSDLNDILVVNLYHHLMDGGDI